MKIEESIYRFLFDKYEFDHISLINYFDCVNNNETESKVNIVDACLSAF